MENLLSREYSNIFMDNMIFELNFLPRMTTFSTTIDYFQPLAQICKYVVITF